MAQINDPRKLFTYKLGTALSGEKKILSMLKQLEKRAQDEQLKQQFRQHRDETEVQIQNIEQAFSALGEKPSGHANPTVEGHAQHANSLFEKADEKVVDSVLASGAAETEHIEIALYEDLITQARAMGEQQVVSLLEQNLQQEQQTLEQVKRVSEQLAQQQAPTAASSSWQQS